VSLILEALKKLEREKQQPDRGFLVMAQVPWAGEGRRGKALLGLGLLVAVVVAAGAVLVLRRGDETKPPAPVESAPAAPSPPPSSPAAPLGPAGTAPAIAVPPRFVPPPARPAFPPSPRAAAPRTVPASPAAAQPAAAAPAAALRLEAVSEQDGVAVAVINGQLVRAGDHIGEAVVVRIGVDEVEVEVEGRRSVLRF
jgi:hypothetical protein